MRTTTKATPGASSHATAPRGDALRSPLVDGLGAPNDPILRKATGAAAIGAQGAFSAATRGTPGAVPFRSEMESSFGQDFSGVKAFTGRSAEASAMGAEAATQGESIVFADASPSKQTVAHELGHVGQFRRGDVPRGQGAFGPSGGAAEREADAAASAVTRGEPAHAAGPAEGAIHLRAKPGNAAVDVPAIVSYADFKEKTNVLFASRGANLEAIDNWLKALDKYTQDADAAKFDNALDNCLAATQHWLAAHADADGQNRSVKARFPHVQALSDALATVKAGGVAQVQSLPSALATTQPEANDDPHGGHVAKGVTELVPSGTGVVGMGSDVHGDDSAYGKLGAEGKHDAAEGGFVAAGGLVDIGLGIEQFKKEGAYNKVKGATGVMAGVGKIGGGVAKSVAGASKMAGGDNNVAAATSEGFGAGVSMLSVISEGADFVKGISDAAEDPGLTGDQKVAFTAERAKNLINMGKGVADSVNAITKAATGAANAGAASASGALGVATGSIDILHGGYQVVTALSDKSKLDDTQQNLGTTIQRLKDEKQTAEEDKAKELRLARRRRSSQRKLDEITQRYDQIIAALDAQILELEGRRAEFDTAITAMHKVQDRRLKSGAFKMATGSLDVVSGALVLSGIGAPVAIGLAAFSALLKLGSVALDVGRSWKTSKLTGIAIRLNDAGSVKGKPDDPSAVGYRTMEKRVMSAYYANYVGAMHDKTPPDGMSSDDWSHVRDFVQEEKLGRVKEGQKQQIPVADAGSKSKDQLEGAWGELTDASGKVVEKEYPSRSRRANLTFTFSAAKSKEAVDASNAELAAALVKIGLGAFDPAAKGFVDTPVLPIGSGEGTQTSEGAKMQKAMAATLLGNVGITPEVWLKLWRGAGGHFAGDADPANPGTPFAAHAAPDWGKFEAFVKGKVDAT